MSILRMVSSIEQRTELYFIVLTRGSLHYRVLYAYRALISPTHARLVASCQVASR